MGTQKNHLNETDLLSICLNEMIVLNTEFDPFSRRIAKSNIGMTIFQLLPFL